MTSSLAENTAHSGANPGQHPSRVQFAGLSRWIGAKGLQWGDLSYLGFLAAAAIWIWVRDLAWLSAAGETLPILAVLPIFVWLGSPWRLREDSFSLPLPPLVAASLLTSAGLATDLTLLLAAGWTCALWIWFKERVIGETALKRRLAILPLMAFPWVALDFAQVGWWFRLSGAWVADHLYAAMGFSVVREGTNLLVHGVPFEVAAPCSGMNSLQAILMGGLVLTWIDFSRNRRYWWLVASLPVLAWVANSLRVCAIIAMAVGSGSEVARGPFHQIGGWAVVLAVFFGWSMAAKRVAGARQINGIAKAR
jgi:exosortase